MSSIESIIKNVCICTEDVYGYFKYIKNHIEYDNGYCCKNFARFKDEEHGITISIQDNINTNSFRGKRIDLCMIDENSFNNCDYSKERFMKISKYEDAINILNSIINNTIKI